VGPSTPRPSTCGQSTSDWPTWGRAHGTNDASQIGPFYETAHCLPSAH
jgi:hypothetical protein